MSDLHNIIGMSTVSHIVLLTVVIGIGLGWLVIVVAHLIDRFL